MNSNWKKKPFVSSITSTKISLEEALKQIIAINESKSFSAKGLKNILKKHVEELHNLDKIEIGIKNETKASLDLILNYVERPMTDEITPRTEEERNLADRISYINTIAEEGAEDILRYGSLTLEDKAYVENFQYSSIDKLSEELESLRDKLYNRKLTL